MANPNKNDKRTTIAGIMTALAVILTAAAGYVDADPETAGNMKEILGGIGAIGSALGVSWLGFLTNKADS